MGRDGATFDAYVFVTPKYNRTFPGALKSAIDFVYAEWNNKAAGFVSYGINGGVLAVEHLRNVMGALGIATVSDQVALSLHNDFVDFTVFKPQAHQEDAVTGMWCGHRLGRRVEAVAERSIATSGAMTNRRQPRWPLRIMGTERTYIHPRRASAVAANGLAGARRA